MSTSDIIIDNLYKYNRNDRIGGGHFGEVYRGVSITNPTKVVAVKEIFENEDISVDEMKSEIKVHKKVSHSNIARIFYSSVYPDHIAIVMEYCNGGNLQEYLREKGSMNENEIREFVKQMASALTALREKKVIHRDIKPGNIALHYPVRARGSPMEICFKLVDFGLGRIITSKRGAFTQCGTKTYMAPEMWAGWEYDFQVDIWSMGLTLIECLTGKHPYKDVHLEIDFMFNSIFRGEFNFEMKIPYSTSKELRSLILEMLNRNPIYRIACNKIPDHLFVTVDADDDTVESSLSTESGNASSGYASSFSENTRINSNSSLNASFTDMVPSSKKSSGVWTVGEDDFPSKNATSSRRAGPEDSWKMAIAEAKTRHQKPREPTRHARKDIPPKGSTGQKVFPYPTPRMMKQLADYPSGQTIFPCTPEGRVEWTPQPEDWDVLLQRSACSSPHLMLPACLGGGISALLLNMEEGDMVEIWSCLVEIPYNIKEVRLPVKVSVDVKMVDQLMGTYASLVEASIVIWRELGDFDFVCTIPGNKLSPQPPMFVLTFVKPQ